METNFQSLFLTTFSAPELKLLLRQELEAFFERKSKSDLEQPEDKLLNVREAASLLSYSVPSMYRLINAKQIPNFKRGGKILFSKDELIQWAEDGRRQTITQIGEAAERHLGILGSKKAQKESMTQVSPPSHSLK